MPVAYTSVFHPVSSFVVNNDVPIVIEGTTGSQTFYTYGPTGGSIPDPTSTSASAPVGYQDGHVRQPGGLLCDSASLPRYCRI